MGSKDKSGRLDFGTRAIIAVIRIIILYALILSIHTFFYYSRRFLRRYSMRRPISH